MKGIKTKRCSSLSETAAVIVVLLVVLLQADAVFSEACCSLSEAAASFSGACCSLSEADAVFREDIKKRLSIGHCPKGASTPPLHFGHL